MIVAGLCCLVVVSAMLAFRDWPGAEESRPDGSVTLRVPELKAEGRVATGPVAAPAAAVASTSAGDADAERAAVRRRGMRAPRRQPAPATPRTPAAPAPPAGTAPQTVSVPESAPSAPAGGGNGGSAGKSATGGGGGGGGGGTPPAPAPQPAGPVEQLVVTGRDVVDEAPLPPAPPVVQEPVDQLLDTTEGAARTVDQLAAPLLP